METYKSEVSQLYSLTQEQKETNESLTAEINALIEKNTQLDEELTKLSDANAALASKLRVSRDEQSALQERLDVHEQSLAKIEESNVAAAENQARKSGFVEKLESDKVVLHSVFNRYMCICNRIVCLFVL